MLVVPEIKELQEKQRVMENPSCDDLLSRVNYIWQLVGNNLDRGQRTLDIPLRGESEEVVKETIEALEEQCDGYTFKYRFIDGDPIVDKRFHTRAGPMDYITGYLTFHWDVPGGRAAPQKTTDDASESEQDDKDTCPCKS